MSPTAGPRLALCLCVRDEEAMIGAHLAYHRALGVERAYVFADRSSDATERIARAFPWVHVESRSRVPYGPRMRAFQDACAGEALEGARAEGIEWLLALDADEFAWGDHRPVRPRRAAPCPPSAARALALREAGSLTAMLAAVPPDVETVRLRVREAVPRAGATGPFWTMHDFRVRPGPARVLLDPITGARVRCPGWLGHERGKTVARTSAPLVPHGPHAWRRADGSRPHEARHGLVHHFVVTSADHWRAKYAKLGDEPAVWQNGKPVRTNKQIWKEASVRLTEAEAARYFERWIARGRIDLLVQAALGRVVRSTVVDELVTHALREGEAHSGDA